jgi:hypothetical protein
MNALKNIYKGYDRKLKIKSEWSNGPVGPLSEKGAQRMKDREEWIRKVFEEHEARKAAIREQRRLEQEEKERQQKEHSDLVEKFLSELRLRNPDLEARRLAMIQVRGVL